MIPRELPGVVIAERKRCGKPRCRCASGQAEDLHGPYFYRYFRQAGRLRKVYVRRADVAEVRRACRQRQERQRQERARAREAHLIITTFRDEARELEHLLRHVKRQRQAR